MATRTKAHGAAQPQAEQCARAASRREWIPYAQPLERRCDAMSGGRRHDAHGSDTPRDVRVGAGWGGPRWGAGPGIIGGARPATGHRAPAGRSSRPQRHAAHTGRRARRRRARSYITAELRDRANSFPFLAHAGAVARASRALSAEVKTEVVKVRTSGRLAPRPHLSDHVSQLSRKK